MCGLKIETVPITIDAFEIFIKSCKQNLIQSPRAYKNRKNTEDSQYKAYAAVSICAMKTQKYNLKKCYNIPRFM